MAIRRGDIEQALQLSQDETSRWLTESREAAAEYWQGRSKDDKRKHQHYKELYHRERLVGKLLQMALTEGPEASIVGLAGRLKIPGSSQAGEASPEPVEAYLKEGAWEENHARSQTKTDRASHLHRAAGFAVDAYREAAAEMAEQALESPNPAAGSEVVS